MKTVLFLAALFVALCSSVFGQLAPGQVEYTFSGSFDPATTDIWGGGMFGDGTFQASVVIDYSVTSQVTYFDDVPWPYSRFISFSNAVVSGHISVNGGASWDTSSSSIHFQVDDGPQPGTAMYFGMPIASPQSATISTGATGDIGGASLGIRLPSFQYIEGGTLGECLGGFEDFSSSYSGFEMQITDPNSPGLIFQGDDFSVVVSQVSPVPEPSTWTLIGGFIALVFTAMRPIKATFTKESHHA